MSTEFVYSPRDVVSPGKEIEGWVKFCDADAGKLWLTLVEMKAVQSQEGLPLDKFDELVGQEVDGTITRITNFGAFLNVGCEVDAFLHATQLPKHKHNGKRQTLQDLVIGRTVK
ncbi:hypothetical protein GUITHDRAFT_149367, partial [Guillardia theta CCMP2712]